MENAQFICLLEKRVEKQGNLSSNSFLDEYYSSHTNTLTLKHTHTNTQTHTDTLTNTQKHTYLQI